MSTEEEPTGRSMAAALSIAGAVIIPAGLVAAGLLGKWAGLAGALAGYAVASLHTALSLYVLRWASGKPLKVLPTILMVTMWARIIALGVVLYALSRVPALNAVAMLISFLVLFIAYTAIEIAFSWRSLAALAGLRKDDD